MPNLENHRLHSRPGARVLFLDHSLVYDKEKYYNLAGQLILSNAIRVGAASPESKIQQIHGVSDDEALEMVRSFGPDVVGLSAYVWNTPRFLNLARRIRAEMPRTMIILGGASALAVTRGLYQGDDGLDCVVGGEGEEVFSELLLNGYTPGVAGVFVRRDGGWHSDLPVGVVKDLEALPSPFDGFMQFDYPMSPVLVESARGCPYSCTYCSWPSKGNKRMRSVGKRRIHQQVAWAVEQKVGQAWILDAAINYEMPIFEELMDAFKYEDPKRTLKTFYFLKYEFLQPGMAGRIADSMFTQDVHMPIESTNPDALREVRRPFNAKRFEAALAELKSAGIRPTVELMLGLPADTLEGFMNSLHYLVGLEVNVNVFQVVAYPGSVLYDKREQYGFDLAEYPLPMVLSTPGFGRDDMEKARENVREVSRELRNSGAGFSVFMEGPEAAQEDPRGPKLGVTSAAGGVAYPLN